MPRRRVRTSPAGCHRSARSRAPRSVRRPRRGTRIGLALALALAAAEAAGDVAGAPAGIGEAADGGYVHAAARRGAGGDRGGSDTDAGHGRDAQEAAAGQPGQARQAHLGRVGRRGDVGWDGMDGGDVLLTHGRDASVRCIRATGDLWPDSSGPDRPRPAGRRARRGVQRRSGVAIGLLRSRRDRGSTAAP